ncbi:unnamed protein product [Moneuplotes crassus]|uniref:Uncharacterized protein n=1 Tax=Euplotes crassus TaxID=5936 RepID=A0AAD1U9R0_EUPCR|nr:unnamed protein product [Moneuplotes crassus]
MDLVKVPSWWGHETRRPGTAQAMTARNNKTRTGLLETRKNKNLKTNTLVKEIPSTVPHYETLPAGMKQKPRDTVDLKTVDEDFDVYQLNADIRRNKEIKGYGTNYSSLSTLRRGRLAKEQRDQQHKFEEFTKNKSQIELERVKIHTNLAKKINPKPRYSKSQVEIRPDEIDPRDPTLQYVKEPKINARSKLLSNRKKMLLRDMKKYENCVDNHKTSEQRLNHREDCFMRLSAREPKIIVKKNEEFEPNVKYGIHNNPLPHFYKHAKKWWTEKKGYKESPKEVSHLKLMHNMLMKNSNDTLLLQDYEQYCEKTHSSQLIRNSQKTSDKPKNLKLPRKFKKKKAKMRWSNGILLHAKREKVIVEHKPPQVDLQPLFSSFNQKGVFKPPPSSKESLVRQKEREKKQEREKQKSNNQSTFFEHEANSSQVAGNEKTTIFKRVKTAYGGRNHNMYTHEVEGHLAPTKGSTMDHEKNSPRNQESNNGWFNSQDQVEKNQWTIKSTSRVGFRTSAFPK